ncbi:MAG TPA: helix-turn-helix transcriptional regulator [Ochrobactrum intermedium]|uniref:Helix-turn-helix transcriptional regulator n=1 Tax=Brucella intermedia TaxID=94625 RepID=A0A7V6PEX1_9HYPH|nr:helix-turn-helix transcriptional regulator [Brucella intermedia]HHV69687.1 helix-turn-helix transcriptional regulator [Brucella intermedia]
MSVISPAQCRAARALLGWSQDELAKLSKVSKATLANFELDKRTPYERTLVDLQKAFEAAGVVFMADGEMVSGGAGVRLKLS